MSSTTSARHARRRTRIAAAGAATALLSATALVTGATGASAATANAGTSNAAPGIKLPAGFHASVFAKGGKLTGPDDITELDGHVFVGYQNGVGPNGEPSPTGNTKSAVVEYTLQGKVLGSWSLTGKVDGLGADAQRHFVIATTNEDSSSGLSTIKPLGDGRVEIKHYKYSQNPLPHGGGTDSVIVRNGVIYLSASNPSADANGTTFSGPALYTAELDGGTAVVKPVLNDNSTAVDAVTGKQVTLNLSDPDSSEVVPQAVPRFGNDVLLDSQGDGELIFLHHPDSRHQTATVLHISTQVDDSAFATEPCGTLLVVDNGLGEILTVTGPFQRGEAFAAVPNDSTVIPGNLATVNLSTGQVTAFGSGFANPHGLLFVEH
ncbi:hypothetical protein [Actinospica sp.]|uniref:hypothetical protein n=1 Tax=Actinospica sp. TaxID=1872142 RepID=UPI002B71CA7F|nr:hypothetical protein [Actinospica sp.]HWG24776.1 hypothetical protein [Actinospica sp.]